eukprot:12526923-Alexandrium_andersonii.AAC.1
MSANELFRAVVDFTRGSSTGEGRHGSKRLVAKAAVRGGPERPRPGLAIRGRQESCRALRAALGNPELEP